MLCERYACINDAEYLVDYVERATGKAAFQKKMCSRHKKATYLCYRIERIEVMNEEEKEVVKTCCYGCEKNDAVCDLIFGELAEVYRIPWCAHCVCPDNWNASPFHHAETYNTGKKHMETCEETGCIYNAVFTILDDGREANVCPEHAKGKPVIGNVKHPYQVEKEKEISIEKCEVTGCHFNARPYDNLCEEHAEHVAKSLENEPALPYGKCADAFQGNLFVKDNPSLKITANEAIDLYTRQPHYEGGIDPITYGQDNFTPEEMNGFYKMNVIKYVSRCDRKNGLEDLKKAQDYLNLLIKSYEDVQPTPVGKFSGRKARIAKYKAIMDGEDLPLSEEEVIAWKEAELQIDRFHADLPVEIKNPEVLKIVQERLKGYSYSSLYYGDGTTFIEKHKES